VEFATTSVTAPGFESAGLGGLASTIDGTLLTNGVNGSGMGLVSDVNYSDTQRRGYLLMTVTAANVKGEFVFVDNIKTKTYAATVGKTVTVAAANLAVSYS
jgi:alkaline phosphatase D